MHFLYKLFSFKHVPEVESVDKMHSAMQEPQSCAEAVQAAAASSSSRGEARTGPQSQNLPVKTPFPASIRFSFLVPVACQPAGGASFSLMLFTVQLYMLKHLYTINLMYNKNIIIISIIIIVIIIQTCDCVGLQCV